jgi:hypothetical protein
MSHETQGQSVAVEITPAHRTRLQELGINIPPNATRISTEIAELLAPNRLEYNASTGHWTDTKTGKAYLAAPGYLMTGAGVCYPDLIEVAATIGLELQE